MTSTTKTRNDDTHEQTAPTARWRGHLLPAAVITAAVAMTLCAAAVMFATVHAGAPTPVLAVVRPVPPGQALANTDLTVVRVLPDPSLDLVPAGHRWRVIGRPAQLPIRAGSLLSEHDLGPAPWPPAGWSVLAVPVTAVHTPSGLYPGAPVTVVLLPPPGSCRPTPPCPNRAASRALATVVATRAGDVPGSTAVSLMMRSPDASRLADQLGDVVLVLRGAGQ